MSIVCNDRLSYQSAGFSVDRLDIHFAAGSGTLVCDACDMNIPVASEGSRALHASDLRLQTTTGRTSDFQLFQANLRSILIFQFRKKFIHFVESDLVKRFQNSINLK